MQIKEALQRCIIPGLQRRQGVSSEGSHSRGSGNCQQLPVAEGTPSRRKVCRTRSKYCAAGWASRCHGPCCEPSSHMYAFSPSSTSLACIKKSAVQSADGEPVDTETALRHAKCERSWFQRICVRAEEAYVRGTDRVAKTSEDFLKATVTRSCWSESSSPSRRRSTSRSSGGTSYSPNLHGSVSPTRAPEIVPPENSSFFKNNPGLIPIDSETAVPAVLYNRMQKLAARCEARGSHVLVESVKGRAALLPCFQAQDQGSGLAPWRTVAEETSAQDGHVLVETQKGSFVASSLHKEKAQDTGPLTPSQRNYRRRWSTTPRSTCMQWRAKESPQRRRRGSI